MADLEYTVENGVATILLNRPERKNAFTLEMIDEWAQHLVEARTDPDVRVIVVTGAPGAFCSGVDLGTFGDERPSPLEQKSKLFDRIHRIAFALEDLDKPVIAAINGPAVGAGLDMALMCDLRFMARSARIAEGYIKVGLIPGDGGAYYLPRLVGVSKALELLWTGEFVASDEALRIGMVNRVYDDEQLMRETYDFAAKLVAAPPLNIALIKRAVYQSSRTDLRTALDLISSHMAVVQSTDDSREALRAFQEKRPGSFVGH